MTKLMIKFVIGIIIIGLIIGGVYYFFGDGLFNKEIFIETDRIDINELSSEADNITINIQEVIYSGDKID